MRNTVFSIGVVLLLINALSLMAGGLFKVMHWPLANETLLTGAIGTSIGLVVVLVGLFLKKSK